MKLRAWPTSEEREQKGVIPPFITVNRFWKKPLPCDNKCSMQELFFLMELESDMAWEKWELMFKGNVCEADLIVLAFLSVLRKG